VGDLSKSARRCRDLGHSWDWTGDFEIVRRGARIIECTRVATCDRCGTERVQIIEIPSMRVKTRRYEYPDNYLGVKGAHLDGSTIRGYEIERFLATPAGKRTQKLRSVGT